MKIIKITPAVNVLLFITLPFTISLRNKGAAFALLVTESKTIKNEKRFVMKKKLFSAVAILGLIATLSSCVVYDHGGGYGYHRHYHHRHYYHHGW